MITTIVVVDFIFRAVLGLQKNWAESTENSHIPLTISTTNHSFP